MGVYIWQIIGFRCYSDSELYSLTASQLGASAPGFEVRKNMSGAQSLLDTVKGIEEILKP